MENAVKEEIRYFINHIKNNLEYCEDSRCPDCSIAEKCFKLTAVISIDDYFEQKRKLMKNVISKLSPEDIVEALL